MLKWLIIGHKNTQNINIVQVTFKVMSASQPSVPQSHKIVEMWPLLSVLLYPIEISPLHVTLN